jgi:ATP-binding cassette subfamily B protein
MRAPFRLLSALKPLPGFLYVVARRFPLMRWAFALTLMLLVLEYAVFSLMIPLATDEGGKGGAAGVVLRFWSHIAALLSVPATRMTWLWLFLLLLGARMVLGYAQLLLSAWVSKQVHRDLSERTFRRVMALEPMTEIYRRSIGYYLRLAGDDTFKAGTIVLTASQSMATLTSVAASCLLLYLFSASVFLWTLLFLGVAALAVGLAFGGLLRANASSVQLSSRASTTYVEALNGLRSIRSMNAERFVIGDYSEQIRSYVRMLFEIEAIRNGMRFLPAMLALFAGAVAVWPGTARVDGLTAGYFFAATTLLIRLFVALGAFINSASMLMTDMRAVTDIHALVGENEPGAQGLADGGDAGSHVPVGEIELRDIRYGYREGHDVLDGLNLTLRRGQVIAVTGPSGSGKSTLADLLLGLVEPRSGSILINGGALSIAQLRRDVVLVEQQARIFSTNVRENVLLGSRHSDDEVWEALREVELETYVRGLPHGLDSPFDYQGANLSGGQRQRLGIARALIRQPQVLILDEATSALDSATRDRLLANLRSSRQRRITIFITHDHAVEADADRVLALVATPAAQATPDVVPAG